MSGPRAELDFDFERLFSLASEIASASFLVGTTILLFISLALLSFLSSPATVAIEGG